jgi:hypothetical protein
MYFLGITMGSMLWTTWVPDLTKNVRTIKPKGSMHAIKQLPYPPHVKDINPNLHVWVFKVIIKTVGVTKYKTLWTYLWLPYEIQS